MAVWVCKGCTAAYSVGAPRCPQCGSTEVYQVVAPVGVKTSKKS
jgi:RNA polymerase subunit RPABC4/transcription elongation factor Spt4